MRYAYKKPRIHSARHDHHRCAKYMSTRISTRDQVANEAMRRVREAEQARKAAEKAKNAKRELQELGQEIMTTLAQYSGKAELVSTKFGLRQTFNGDNVAMVGVFSAKMFEIVQELDQITTHCFQTKSTTYLRFSRNIVVIIGIMTDNSWTSRVYV